MERTSVQSHSHSKAQRVVELVQGNGGLAMVRIATPECRGEIYLHGAQVTKWAPAHERDVLWVSQKSKWERGRAIRGGIPVCFPWFGSRRDGGAAPQHGFARLKEWELKSVDDDGSDVVVRLALASDAESKRWWDADFELQMIARFGAQLTTTLVLSNTGQHALRAEEALHTYLAVGDVRQVSLTGLEDTQYLDSAAGSAKKQQQGVVVLEGETDRVYLNTSKTVEIQDPVLNRVVFIEKRNSAETVVWNPWGEKAASIADFGEDQWSEMLCVEACNIRGSAIELAPGEQHETSSTLSVETLNQY